MLHFLLALILSYLAGRWCVGMVTRAHEPLNMPAISVSQDWVVSLCLVLDIILYWLMGWGWTWIAGVVLVTYLVSLTWIDLKTLHLPTHLTNALLWLGLLFNLFGHFTAISSAVLGVIVGYVTLSVIYWVFKWWTDQEGLGLGDAKFLAALGAWLGWHALGPLLLFGSMISLVVVGLMMLVGRYQKGQPIPFGPGVAMAAYLIIVYQVLAFAH